MVHKELYKLDMHFNGNMKPTVLSINIESEKEFANSLGIVSIPTLVFVGQANPTAPALMVKVCSIFLESIYDARRCHAGPVTDHGTNKPCGLIISPHQCCRVLSQNHFWLTSLRTKPNLLGLMS